MFAKWGLFVHRRRGAVLLTSGLLLALSLTILVQGGTLLSYQVPEDTESGHAQKLLEDQLGAGDATFLVILSHPTLTWREAAFKASALAALAPLDADARVREVLTPYDVPAANAGPLVAHDGRRILAVVTMRDDLTTSRDAFPEIRAQLRSPALDITTTGSVAVYSEIEDVLAEDLTRSEAITLPLVLLLLLLVFGTVVAALLPLGVGLLAVASGVAGVLLGSRFTDMSVYAMNIVTLIGLGVAIDYSLFIVSRFREELPKHPDTASALAATMATAGRATAFSGLTVAVGLAGLGFYRGLFFASVGVAGAIVVAFAVLYALTFLAAILAYLGPRVDRWRVPALRMRTRGLWERIARGVMRRPALVLIPTLALVLLAGSPFLRLEMGSAGAEMLPEDAQTRRGLDTLDREFPSPGRNVLSVVVQYPGDPLAPERVSALYAFTRDLRALDGVVGVESVVDVDPRLDAQGYQRTYEQPRASLPPPLQEALNDSVGRDVVLVRVRSDLPESSAAARELVADVRAMPAPADGRVLVTGASATDKDTLDLVYRYTPAAIVFVVVTTYLLLLVQTGSIVLPAKAILMNFLSIAASFGALVWIFQDGNLSAILHFTPAPIDPSIPVLLFCIVFGLSMDYEVLLLSRMHEEWDATGDNAKAVAAGLAKSGRLITSAASIMIIVFGGFALAQITMIKAIGLGLALAIFIDATLVRALVVPATMRLMGRANWWAPPWIARALRPLRH